MKPISIKISYVSLMLLLLIPQMAQAVLIRWSCESVLAGEASVDRFIHKVGTELAAPREMTMYASNEDDWWRGYQKEMPSVDLVAGIGTNAVWDLAVRMNARKLVLVDYSSDALVGTAFFLAPLLKISKTPAHFLSLISGYPIPDDMLDKPTPSVFAYIDEQKAKPSSETLELKTAYRDQIIQKLQNASVEQRNFVYDYLTAIITLDQRTYQNPQERDHLGPFDTYTSSTYGNYYRLFRIRYYSKSFGKGASGFEVLDQIPMLNPFNSQAAFERIQELFNTVEYVQANLFDPNLYIELKKIGDRAGAKSYAFNMSNVVSWTLGCKYNGRSYDFAEHIQASKDAMANMLVLASPDHPVQILETYGVFGGSHQFRRYPVQQKSDLDTLVK